ncbi:MAG TPA: hypothetical protein VGN16_05415 [Acidobacteriaceae bacterium]|jgi:hypothetical protein
MRRRNRSTLLVALVLVIALAVVVILRQKSPPEAARLLPESDAILYMQFKTLRAVTHFDASPVKRSPDFQKFIDATGIVPERDLDEAAFALHRMPDPKGPNGPVAYSEVFVGRFDGQRLNSYLAGIASAHETYAGHEIYSIPIEGRTLRVTQLGYDTVAASNMPTAEQIHSILDRSRASALSSPGSSLLAARYSEVPRLPLPPQAWGIGHIGLPFSQNGHISILGLELPLREDTDLVASLRYSGSIHLRVDEIAPDAATAERTVETLTALLSVLRGLGSVEPPHSPADAALREILGSAKLEQHKTHAELDAYASPDQLKALASQAANPVTPEP